MGEKGSGRILRWVWKVAAGDGIRELDFRVGLGVDCYIYQNVDRKEYFGSFDQNRTVGDE